MKRYVLACSAVVAASTASCLLWHPFGRECLNGAVCDGPDLHCGIVETDDVEYGLCLPCSSHVLLDEVPAPEVQRDIEVSAEVDVDIQCDGADHYSQDGEGAFVKRIVLIETSLVDFTAYDIIGVEGDIVIVENELLREIYLPSLEAVGGRIVIARNGRLVDVYMPSLTDARGILMADNASDAGSCEDQLAREKSEGKAYVCAQDAGCTCGDPADIEASGMFHDGGVGRQE